MMMATDITTTPYDPIITTMYSMHDHSITFSPSRQISLFCFTRSALRALAWLMAGWGMSDVLPFGASQLRSWVSLDLH
jgi:hypothetical protein